MSLSSRGESKAVGWRHHITVLAAFVGPRLFVAVMAVAASIVLALVLLCAAGAIAPPALLSFVCTQSPDRSWMFDGEMLPLCVRCIGIYAGVVASSIFYRRLYSFGPGRLLPAFALAVAVSIVLKILRWDDLAAVRFAAGLAVGSTVLGVGTVAAAKVFEVLGPTALLTRGSVQARNR